MGNPTEMEIPKSPSNYTKLEEGTTKLRILSDFVEWFKDRDESEKKSITYRKDECPSEALNKDGFVYFRWCVVWNYDLKMLQIFEIKSKQIMHKIKALYVDQDRWKDLEYDLKISKTWVKKDTKYEVIPCNKAPVSQEIADAYVKADIELESLFEWIDPMKK